MSMSSSAHPAPFHAMDTTSWNGGVSGEAGIIGGPCVALVAIEGVQAKTAMDRTKSRLIARPGSLVMIT